MERFSFSPGHHYKSINTQHGGRADGTRRHANEQNIHPDGKKGRKNDEDMAAIAT